MLQRDEVDNRDYLLIDIYQTGATGTETGVWNFRIKHDRTLKSKVPAAADSHSICCRHVCPGSALRNHGIPGTFRVKRFWRTKKKQWIIIHYLKLKMSFSTWLTNEMAASDLEDPILLFWAKLSSGSSRGWGARSVRVQLRWSQGTRYQPWSHTDGP